MGIEKAFIESYDGLQENVLECLMFSDCILAQDVGSYVKGSTVPVIAFNFETSEMKFYTHQGVELMSFKIGLVIL